MRQTFREKIYEVIYGTDTYAGRAFDVALIWLILISILIICLESIPSIQKDYLAFFIAAEWFFTFIFSFEYLFRIYSHPKPLKYITSFYGLIDLISILPSFLTFIIPGVHYLMNIRVLRLLRIFRILKLTHFITNAQALTTALTASVHKILVFILAVLSLVLIVGTIIYVVEGPENGFTSIPLSIYWTIVTITTVGYGDITPRTPLGQMISSLVMLMGYAIIAVPTGIVTVELSKTGNTKENTNPSGEPCPRCATALLPEANYCSKCGAKIMPETPSSLTV